MSATRKNNCISWIQISDLHLNKRGAESQRIRTKLLEYLRDTHLSVDYLFVLGDLRYAPEGSFDQGIVAYIESLMETVGVSTEHLFIVPGNHDVNRANSERSNAVKGFWRKKNDQREYYNYREGVIYEDILTGAYSGLEEFRGIIDNIYKTCPERIQLYHTIDRPHFCVETEDLNIIHVNSALFYDNEHQDNLLIGRESFFNALSEIDCGKPTIVLSHYSFDYLDRIEQITLYELLTDYNAKIWLSGHSHYGVLNKYRDYLYSFQCGSLIHEQGVVKNSILIGEYRPDSRDGIVRGIDWDSTDGWKESKDICKIGYSDKYLFELYENDELKEKIDKYLNMDHTGDDSAYQENTDSYTWEQHLQHVPIDMSTLVGDNVYNKESYQGFIYLNNSVAPFSEVKVVCFSEYSIKRYVISNDSFTIIAVGMPQAGLSLVLKYDLSRYHDVDRRLFHYEKIKGYLESCEIFVKVLDHEEYNLRFKNPLETDEWNQNMEGTEWWIGVLTQLAEIENYYDLKFALPSTFDEEEYCAISVLCDSVNGRENRRIPPVSTKKPGREKIFELEERKMILSGEHLPALDLLGYSFIPVGQYMLPGTYRWNKRFRGWGLDDSVGGIPVWVNFRVSVFENRGRELEKCIPYDDIANELVQGEIWVAEGDAVDFSEYYVSVTRCYLEIEQLFLKHKKYVESFILFEGEDDCEDNGNHNEKHNEKHNGWISKGALMDKLSVNGSVNMIVSSGNQLVNIIDEYIDLINSNRDIGENNHQEKMSSFFDSKYYTLLYNKGMRLQNVGYIWMMLMETYSGTGHFPVSVIGREDAFYDIPTLFPESSLEDSYDELLDLIKSMKKEFISMGFELEKVPLYDMLRNYLYIVASIYKEFSECSFHELDFLVNMLQSMIEEEPNLLHKGGLLDNHILCFSDQDDQVLHAFDVSGDILGDARRVQFEANRYYKMVAPA